MCECNNCEYRMECNIRRKKEFKNRETNDDSIDFVRVRKLFEARYGNK